jgi:hypothetical protein
MPTAWKVPPPLEKTVQQHVKQALASLGFHVSDLSQPRRTMQTVGLPDLWAMHPRWRLALWIEVKRPGGKVSLAQSAWHQVARDAGVHVLVVWGVADLVEGLKALGAPLGDWSQPRCSS